MDPIPMTVELTELGVEALRRELDKQQPPYIPATEAAAKLGVNYETVIRNHKQLGGFKVGGVWRFPKDVRPQVAEPPTEGRKPSRRRRKPDLTEGTRKLKVRGRRPEKSV